MYEYLKINNLNKYIFKLKIINDSFYYILILGVYKLYINYRINKI